MSGVKHYYTSVNGWSVAQWWGVHLALITLYCTLLLFLLTPFLQLFVGIGQAV